MNAKIVEEFVQKRLKRLLGKKIAVTKGPLVVTKLTGIHPEVSVHAARVQDFDGIMPDCAHTVRRPAKGESTYKGIQEERPATITLVLTCTAGSYNLVQEIFDILTPGVQLALEMLPRFPLGNLPDNSVTYHFEDFISSFQSSTIDIESFEDFSFYRGELVFFMNGFIHTWLTKRGGFSSVKYNKSKPEERNKTKPLKRKTTRARRKSGDKKTGA